jgi:tRNA 2-thiouridine synthesizing protein A
VSPLPAGPPRRSVDIRAHVCPMTWVRVKLALEALGPGEELDVLLAGDEPLRNVPRSAEGEGHTVMLRESRGDHHLLRLRKAGARAV